MDCLKEIKVQGVSQFKREYEQTKDLETARRVCHMGKLYTNPATGESENAFEIKPDETLIEHCSPRILFWSEQIKETT